MIGAGGVCLGWIHGGQVHAGFMDSVLGACWADPATSRLIGRYETFSAGAHLAAARNQVAAQFLARGRETWLWMLDTDIVFSPELLTRLAATADAKTRPLVSGLYLTTTAGGLPLVPMLYDRTPGGQPEFSPCRGWRPGAVIRVGGCGAGCLLVHRRVLEAVSRDEGGPAWFTEITADGRRFGEDLSFCLRAARAGFPVHADTGARAGHVKPVVLGLAGTGLGDCLPVRAGQVGDDGDNPVADGEVVAAPQPLRGTEADRPQRAPGHRLRGGHADQPGLIAARALDADVDGAVVEAQPAVAPQPRGLPAGACGAHERPVIGEHGEPQFHRAVRDLPGKFPPRRLPVHETEASRPGEALAGQNRSKLGAQDLRP